MGTKSNIITSDTLGNIDLNSTGFKDDGSVRAAVEGGKTYKQIIQGMDKELATMMKNMSSYTAESNNSLDLMLSKLSEVGKGYKEAFSNSLLFKKAKEDILTLTRATEEYNKAVEDQTISDEQLMDIYKRVSLAYQESSDALDALTTATIGQNSSVSDLRTNLKVLYSEVKSGSKSFESDFKVVEKEINNSAKAADKLKRRWTDFASDLSKSISSIKDTLNLEELTKGIGPSTNMQIQTQLQQKYSLTRGQFNALRNSLYGSFDNSLYNADQVIQTMQSLSSMGFRDEKEITKYFDKILKGQQILGMSAENQTALMQLSNKTGKDELTLGTNTFAKYFKEITNVSKEQLNQLVSINTNFASQMADLGVSSDAFRSTNEAITGALTKASGDTNLASLYSQVMGSYSSSTDLAAEMIGMSSGQYKSYLESGGSLLDLLRSGRGRAGNFYNLMSTNRAYALTHQDELTQGMDSSTVSFINQITRLQQEGKLTNDLINKFKGLDGAAIEAELEEITKSNMTEAEKLKNIVENGFNTVMDWKLKDTIDNSTTAITNWLMVISGLLGLIGKSQGFSAIKDILGTAGSVHVAGSGSGILGGLTSLGVSAGATTTGGAAALGGAMVALPLLGLGLAGYDAYKGYQSGGASGATRQFFLGDAYKGNKDNFGSVGKNVGKWAAIGAGVGTLFGPGVGTAIGGAIGGAVGLGLGLWGSTMNKTVKEQEKTNDKLDKVVSNTAKTASALTIKESGRSIVSVVPYSSKVSGGSSGRSFGGPVGSAAGLKYSITSGYGQRDDGFHRGIDFSGGNINGAPLYSNVDGTVVDVGKDPAGANFVGVKGSDGYIHYYWHMIAPSMRSVNERVKQGDLVGYVGSTGYSTGPHLHYQVSRSRYSDGYKAFNNNSVNPWSFATDAIFTGNASYYSPDYGLSDTSLLSSVSKNVSNVKLASLGSPSNSSGIISSIVDLKETIVNLSKQTTANEKLMRAITSTYNTQPRFN